MTGHLVLLAPPAQQVLRALKVRLVLLDPLVLLGQRAQQAPPAQ